MKLSSIFKSIYTALHLCVYAPLLTPVLVFLTSVYFIHCNQDSIFKSKSTFVHSIPSSVLHCAHKEAQTLWKNLWGPPFPSHHPSPPSPLLHSGLTSLVSFLLHIMLPASPTPWCMDILCVFWCPCFRSCVYANFWILAIPTLPQCLSRCDMGRGLEFSIKMPTWDALFSCLTLSKPHWLPNS